MAVSGIRRGDSFPKSRHNPPILMENILAEFRHSTVNGFWETGLQFYKAALDSENGKTDAVGCFSFL